MLKQCLVTIGITTKKQGNMKGSMLEKLARATRLAWPDNSGNHPNYN